MAGCNQGGCCSGTWPGDTDALCGDAATEEKQQEQEGFTELRGSKSVDVFYPGWASWASGGLPGPPVGYLWRALDTSGDCGKGEAAWGQRIKQLLTLQSPCEITRSVGPSDRFATDQAFLRLLDGKTNPRSGAPLARSDSRMGRRRRRRRKLICCSYPISVPSAVPLALTCPKFNPTQQHRIQSLEQMGTHTR